MNNEIKTTLFALGNLTRVDIYIHFVYFMSKQCRSRANAIEYWLPCQSASNENPKLSFYEEIENIIPEIASNTSP